VRGVHLRFAREDAPSFGWLRPGHFRDEAD
jgi:hypothetical protein